MIERRTPLKRGTSELKRTPLRRVSAKRRAQLAEERKLKERLLEENPRCVAEDLVLEVECRGPLDKHELVRRSHWRAGAVVMENCVLVCRTHHDWIGSHPAKAVALGLAKWSTDAPWWALRQLGGG